MQSIGSHPEHHVRLDAAARADIVWWHLFAEEWNEISILWDSSTVLPEFNIFSDVSGSWGYGALWGFQWFHFKWPDQFCSFSIAVKELIPVVVAAAVFGPKWKGRLIQLSVDNLAVVHILCSKDAHLMHLIRILVFLAAHFDFWFVAKHIEGRANSLADNLSRNHLHNFFSQVPQAERHPPPHIPTQLLDLLGNNHLVWTSTDWIRSGSSTILSSSSDPIHTHKTYKAAERKYLSFCSNFSLSPLPTTENILCCFAVCLGQEGLAGSSIQTYLSGIRQIQISAGFPDPRIDQMPRLRQVLEDIRI